MPEIAEQTLKAARRNVGADLPRRFAGAMRTRAGSHINVVSDLGGAQRFVLVRLGAGDAEWWPRERLIGAEQVTR